MKIHCVLGMGITRHSLGSFFLPFMIDSCHPRVLTSSLHFSLLSLSLLPFDETLYLPLTLKLRKCRKKIRKKKLYI